MTESFEEVVSESVLCNKRPQAEKIWDGHSVQIGHHE